MKNKEETAGEEVWRLFSDIIVHYERIFIKSEISWNDRLIRNVNPLKDLSFVMTLNQRLRVFFWLDKFVLFMNSDVLALLLFYVRSQLDVYTFVPDIKIINELLYVLLLFLNENPNEHPYLVHKLRKQFSPLLLNANSPPEHRDRQQGSLFPPFLHEQEKAYCEQQLHLT